MLTNPMVYPMDPMIERQFGRLIVKARHGTSKDGRATWLCECRCGTKVVVVGKHLRLGYTKSCGCLRLENGKLLGKRNLGKVHLGRDLTGQRFERLLVIHRAGQNRFGQYLWLCKCDCGNETTVGPNLVSGMTKSCGCLHRDKAKAKAANLIGQTFERLLVLRRFGSTHAQKATWVCRCSCGNEVIVTTGGLRAKGAISCGCARKEKAHALGILMAKSGQLDKIRELPQSKEAARRNMRSLNQSGVHLIGASKRQNTKLELAVKAKLDALGLRYEHPFNLHDHFLVDFYLPDLNTVIEADGCYWHGCKPCGFNNGKDARTRSRNAYIKAHGYKLVVVPEHEAPDFSSLRLLHIKYAHRSP